MESFVLPRQILREVEAAKRCGQLLLYLQPFNLASKQFDNAVLQKGCPHSKWTITEDETNQWLPVDAKPGVGKSRFTQGVACLTLDFRSATIALRPPCHRGWICEHAQRVSEATVFAVAASSRGRVMAVQWWWRRRWAGGVTSPLLCSRAGRGTSWEASE